MLSNPTAIAIDFFYVLEEIIIRNIVFIMPHLESAHCNLSMDVKGAIVPSRSDFRLP